MSFSYPEGNFGVNQLLDSSISLSPLYACPTNDLHVSIATSLHQSFLWLRPAHAKFTIFRVPSYVLYLSPHRCVAGRCCQSYNFGTSHFHYAYGFSTQILAYMLDSLVRVSRRVVWNHFVNIPNTQIDQFRRKKQEKRWAKLSNLSVSTSPLITSPMACVWLFLNPKERMR